MTERRKTLPPIRPSAAIRAAYFKRLSTLLDQMSADIRRELLPFYADEPTVLAMDTPARDLSDLMRKLARKWQKRFDAIAPELAAYFATEVSKRTDTQLRNALRRAGFSVKFRLTAAQRDVLNATVAENVSLIRSIASQHLTQVEGMVMRSVTAGRDLKVLSQDLQHQLGVTKRRAKLISLDQNNKATSMLERVRHVELGLKAIWLHSAGGKTPRPSHVKNSGNEYDPVTGWYDPDAKEWIWPGTLIRCRCVSKAVLPWL